ncbi:DinB family protein [Pedobacter cryophilus]|uniref:DinB family protein n=1 Tax=Pedobacter cryophilus TaxID=2571271 RepID=UPI00145DAECA|nr:DinB family protein [Pedobacter cryophilus]
MKSHFINLFNYEAWANQQIWTSIEEKPLLNPKIELLFSHLLTAQKVWLNRCLNLQADINIWEVQPNLNEMKLQNKSNWTNYILQLEDIDFDKMISYKNSKGDSFKTSLRDILTHLVNHGTYHRGQIVQLLKEERTQLPVTDYIFWVR